jgi:hypothetical protein
MFKFKKKRSGIDRRSGEDRDAIINLQKNILQIAEPIRGMVWKEDRRLNGGPGGSRLTNGKALRLVN